jgi:hypothetical protein
MQNIVANVETKLKNSCFNEDCVVTINDMRDAVSYLKLHKNDGSSSIMSNHSIWAGNDCLNQIACLLSALIVNGTVPKRFLLSTIVPMPKGKI